MTIRIHAIERMSALVVTLSMGVAFAGCASEAEVSDDELEQQDALLGIDLDLKALKEKKAEKRADLLARQEEEKANPNRRVLTSKLWSEAGPNPEDILQNLSDCYLAAALGAVAHAQPEHLKKNLVPRYKTLDGAVSSDIDGYDVTLYDVSDDLYGPIGEKIEVENSLPLAADGTAKNNKLLFGRTRNGTFWFPLYERAFAYQKGGYDKIGAYGMASAALARISGHHARSGYIAPGRKEAVWKRLRTVEENHQPFVACNVLRKPLLPGMTDWHCNSLVGIEEKDGQRWVKMHNQRSPLFMPKETARVKENTASGVFYLSLDEFTQAFDYMTYTTGM